MIKCFHKAADKFDDAYTRVLYYFYNTDSLLINFKRCNYI